MSEHHAPEYEDSGIPQPYHLVAPSIMPLLGAFAAGLLAVGMILFMHKIKLVLGTFTFEFDSNVLILGAIAVLAVMFFWWKDVIKEAYVEKLHGPLVKIGLRYGMALFIASEVMFFVAFFWAYFSSALYPVGGVWPPEGIHTIDPFELPFVMTIILLLSGSTVTFAHEALVEGRRKDAIQALGLSVLLGVLFTCFQVYEYMNGHFSFKDGIFPSTFFMATGFHGFHVLIGTIFLLVAWVRTAKGQFTKDSHFGFEAAAWYWHFVDVVWLFLFTSVYWWGSGSSVPGHG